MSTPSHRRLRRFCALFGVVCLLGGSAACGGGADGARRTASPTGAHTGTPSAAASPRVDVAGIVKRMSRAEKVGQLFVTRVSGTTAADGTAEKIKKYHLGGVIYFPENLKNPKQIAKLSNGLQRAARGHGPEVPLLVATDQEGGSISRLSGIITDFPGNMPLGATRSTDDTRAAARATAREMRAIGLNFDYAPDADVNVNPDNPVIGIRSFGSDPGLVSRLAGAAIDGYQGANVAASAKHFPGHGDTDTDSHTGLPVITHTRKQWRRIDAPPFRAAIRHHVDVIMTAHVVMPRLDSSRAPATLSKKILTGLLRHDLGYDGVVSTDGLEMAGVREKYGDAQVAIRAVRAGADQLLLPPDLPTAYRAVLGAVGSGKISERRLDRSVTRILRLKVRRGLFSGTRMAPEKAGSRVRTAADRKLAQRIADRSVTLVRRTGDVLPVRGERVFVTGAVTDALAAGLRGHGAKKVTELRTGGTPSTAAIGSAAARAKNADVTVVTTDGADTDSAQRSLVAALRRAGRPVIVVAVGTPYDIAAFPQVDAYLATYSPSEASLRATARILLGTLRSTGRLPVSIPKTGGGTLYKLGHRVN